MKEYYDARAPEYDDWWLGTGRFVDRDRRGWPEEVSALRRTLESLPPARTLDVGCGTGYATRWLPGEITGLDQSARTAIASERVPEALSVRGDGLEPPFGADAFERATLMHFSGQLEAGERERFVAEARRVAPELVLVATPLRDPEPAAEWQERVLDDGSRWTVFKRLFGPEALLDELGGGELLHLGHYFLVVRSLAA